MGTNEKELTGYPSIDKPWLKYYSEEAINAQLSHKTMYQMVYDENKDYLGDYVFNYYGNRITFEDFFTNVDKAAKSLAYLGVKPDDIVTIMGLSTPETLYVSYACSKIGAVINLISVLSGEQEIVNYINEAESTVLFILDLYNDIISRTIPYTNVKTIINLSIEESMPVNIKAAYLSNKNKTNSSYVSWKDFIDLSEGQPDIKAYEYIPNRFTYLAHTGGTTGEPKGVMLTDDTVNGILFEDLINYDYDRQLKFLNTIPPFYSYGFVVNCHIVISRGFESYLFPKIDSSGVSDIIIKEHINIVCSAPQFLSEIPNNKNFQKIDLSFIKTIAAGGDGLTTKLENEINRLIYPNKVLVGYGLTEIGSMGCGTFNKKISGNVGYPASHNIVSVFDCDSCEELQYYEIGELCFNSPYLMLGYYKNEQATSKAIRVHKDGLKWFHTGDLGYVTKEGTVYITGRIKRILLTIKNGVGNKIYPDYVESVLNKHESVEVSCVIKQPSNDNEVKLTAYIVLYPKYASNILSMESNLRSICDNELPEYSRPIKYVFANSLPITAAGKVDYRALEKMEKENE